MSSSSRREFMAGSALAATLSCGSWPHMSQAADDPPRELSPTKADLGSLFPLVEQLADARSANGAAPGQPVPPYHAWD